MKYQPSISRLTRLIIVVIGIMAGSQVYAAASFSDITTSAGISNDSIESSIGNGVMAGGIAWIDYNNDGYQDLFIPNVSTGPSRLLKNNGPGGGFSFSDVSIVANVQLNGLQSAGVAVGDYDADGFDDIFVANINGANTLLRNKGDGTFEDVTSAANLDNETKPSFVASFGDINGDSYLDIYVGHWDTAAGMCSTSDLYINNGNGTFVNEAATVGVDDVSCTFGSTMSDYDGDGDLDILSVHDNIFFAQNWRRNKIFRNIGLHADGTPVFSEQGAEAHFDQLFQGMGIAIGDYNNDGELDYYRTSLGGGYLSTNTGGGVLSTREFAPALPPTGDGPISVTAGSGTTGWGTIFVDADNDGFQDLFRVNRGFANYQPNSFYQNNAGVLGEVRLEVGLNTVSGNGVAAADFDNDGDMDIVIHNGNGEVGLYENTSSSNNWIKVNLNGNGGNLDAIGAKIRVKTPDGNEQLREIDAGSSHGSSNSLVQHFGLGSNTDVSEINVEWPGGCTRKVTGPISVNQEVTYSAGPCWAGHITDSAGIGVADVNLTFWDYNNILGTPVTSDTGAYAFNLPGPHWYLEQAAKDGYWVSPNFKVKVVGATELVFQNHTASARYTFSGVVTDGSGNPLEGVVLTVYDYTNIIDTPVTDSNGAYTFAAPAPGWHLVTAAKQGYQLYPIFKVIIVDETVQTQDFSGSAPYTVTGVAQNSQTGEPIKGVELVVMDTNATVVDTIYTDANGNYTFAAPSSAWYLFNADKDGYTVTPNITGFIVDGTAQTLDFSVFPF